MKYKLLDIFEENLEHKFTVLPERQVVLEKEYKEAVIRRDKQAIAKVLDDKCNQASFELPEGTAVKLVCDMASKKYVTCYDNLPELELTKEEQLKVAKNLENLTKDSKFYDGDQIIITDVLWDSLDKAVYLEGRRTKFSVLQTRQYMLFDPDSPIMKQRLYKTGVIVPFINLDDFTILLERNDRFFSAVAGMCQPLGDKKSLIGRPEANLGLFELTAIIEAIEELLGRKEEAEKFSSVIEQNSKKKREEFIAELQPYSRAEFSLPRISALSLRNLGMGTIEFLAPINLNCTKSRLEEIFRTNMAKDAWEHASGVYDLIPLASQDRKEVVFLKKGSPGWFLYAPILSTASRLVNNDENSLVSGGMPGTRTSIVDIRCLNSTIIRNPSGKKLREQEELEQSI